MAVRSGPNMKCEDFFHNKSHSLFSFHYDFDAAVMIFSRKVANFKSNLIRFN